MIDENKKNLIKLKVIVSKLKDENSNIDSSVTKTLQAMRDIQENIRNLERKGSVL